MTKCLILAAGQGTRLRPITNDKPKCLTPLSGKPMLIRQVETLKSQGIDNIHVATGYRSDQIEKLGFETSLNPRFDTTNMVETLFAAREFLKGSEDLIIAYGDIVYSEENLVTLLESNEEISIMVDENWKDLWSLRLDDPLTDAETLKLNDGLITELGKKTNSYDEIEGQYTGLIKVRGDKVADVINFYDNLDRGKEYDQNNFDNMYMTSFIQLLIDSGWKVKAAIVKNGWLEVDTVEDLEIYEKLVSTNKLSEDYKFLD